MFQTKVIGKIKTYFSLITFLFIFFFRKSCCVEKYCIAGQATNDNTAHALCVLDN